MQFIPLWIEKRVRLILASLLNCVACLLVGPSYILYFPDSLLLICVGLALNGAMVAHQFMPGIPEMVESA